MTASRWAGWRWAVGAALAAGLPGVSACQASDAPDSLPPLERPPALEAGARVLMVGNSLTAANSLADIVEALADSAGLRWEVDALLGGGSLEDHATRGALRSIATAGYDA